MIDESSYSGDAADGMYFIEDGTVSIKIQQDKGETEISKLEKGQYFGNCFASSRLTLEFTFLFFIFPGELALVTHRPRAASAYAQNHVKVACKLCLSTSQQNLIFISFPLFQKLLMSKHLSAFLVHAWT